jgi:hypothetical protein
MTRPSDQQLRRGYHLAGAALIVCALSGISEDLSGERWFSVFQLAGLVMIAFWLPVALNVRGVADRMPRLELVDPRMGFLAAPFATPGRMRVAGGLLAWVGVLFLGSALGYLLG